MKKGTGQTVTVRCVVRDTDGRILDRGLNPLTFALGRDEVFPGLEALVRDRPVGHRGRHRIAAGEAYGEHRPELVFEAVREHLPADARIEVGTVLYPGGSQGRYPLRVVALTEEGVMLDGNHPLAGQELDVEVEVINVQWRSH